MEIWDNFLDAMNRRVSRNTYLTWIAPLVFIGKAGNKIVVEVPTQTFVEALSLTYGEIIRSALYEIGHPGIKLELIVESK